MLKRKKQQFELKLYAEGTTLIGSWIIDFDYPEESIKLPTGEVSCTEEEFKFYFFPSITAHLTSIHLTKIK